MQRANHLGEEVLMLAYAANRPLAGKRPSSPPAMLLIVSAHIALIALVMSAKTEFTRHKPDGPTIYIPTPPSPPPPSGSTKAPQQPSNRPISDPHPDVQLPPRDSTPPYLGPTTDPGANLGNGVGANPQFPINLIPAPVRHDPRLLTPASELRPPYPESKILSDEEATLQLRLTISDTGRVVAVDPVGAADRVFLEAARRYLISHWRYQPATEDGRPIGSTITISLRFQLDG
jgi:periplasmic protein TonB